MGQMIVRNLDDGIIERLKLQAKAANRSLEQQVREILAEAARPARADLLAEIGRIRESTRNRVTGDSTDMVREDRDRR